MHTTCKRLPEHITIKIQNRNYIKKAKICDPSLTILDPEITSDIYTNKQNIWRGHLNSHWYHRHTTHILWKKIHGISNKPKRTHIQQHNHIQHKNCKNRKTNRNNTTGQDKLNVKHLRYLGPPGLAYISNMYNISLNNIILHTWKLVNIIPAYRPISLLSVNANTLEKIILPYITNNIQRTTLSPLDLWTDPAGVTALLARWTEKQGSWEWADNINTIHGIKIPHTNHWTI